jgi:hypothetical protein
MTDRWLVLAHEATNSGAPRMLLEVLRGVRAARGLDWRCDILLDHGGPLAEELAMLGPVQRLTPPWAEGMAPLARSLRTLVDRPWLKPRRLRRAVRTWQAQGGGVIYSNTATNGRLLAGLPASAGPVVTHVHELEYSLQRFNRPQDLAATLARTSLFLAVSTAVAADLRTRGVPAERVKVVPNFLPALPALPDAAAAQDGNLPPSAARAGNATDHGLRAHRSAEGNGSVCGRRQPGRGLDGRTIGRGVAGWGH